MASKKFAIYIVNTNHGEKAYITEEKEKFKKGRLIGKKLTQKQVDLIADEAKSQNLSLFDPLVDEIID